MTKKQKKLTSIKTSIKFWAYNNTSEQFFLGFAIYAHMEIVVV